MYHKTGEGATTPAARSNSARSKPLPRGERVYAPNPRHIGTQVEIEDDLRLSHTLRLLAIKILGLATNRVNPRRLRGYGCCYMSYSNLAVWLDVTVKYLRGELLPVLVSLGYILDFGDGEIIMAQRFYSSKDGYGGSRFGAGEVNKAAARPPKIRLDSAEKSATKATDNQSEDSEADSKNSGEHKKTHSESLSSCHATAEESQSGRERNSLAGPSEQINRDPFGSDDWPEVEANRTSANAHKAQAGLEQHNTSGVLAALTSLGDGEPNICKYEALHKCLEHMDRLDVWPVALASTKATRHQGKLDKTPWAHFSSTAMKLARTPIADLHKKNPVKAERDFERYEAARKHQHALPAPIMSADEHTAARARYDALPSDARAAIQSRAHAMVIAAVGGHQAYRVLSTEDLVECMTSCLRQAFLDAEKEGVISGDTRRVDNQDDAPAPRLGLTPKPSGATRRMCRPLITPQSGEKKSRRSAWGAINDAEVKAAADRGLDDTGTLTDEDKAIWLDQAQRAMLAHGIIQRHVVLAHARSLYVEGGQHVPALPQSEEAQNLPALAA